MEDKAVSEDSEQGGEAFDGVDERDGDDGCGSCGEDVPADLEKRKGESGIDDFSSWGADAVFERGYGGFEGRVEMGQISK